MALTITSNLTVWTNAESGESGTWEVSNISNGHGLNTDEFLQGNSSYSGKVQAAGNSYIIYNYGSNQDLSSKPIIRMWCRFMEIPKFNGDGLRLYVEDGSGNTVEYFIGGGSIGGGYQHLTTPEWQYIYVDTNRPPDVSTGTISWSTIRKIGVRAYTNTKPNRADNIFVDSIRYGPGLKITGTNAIPGRGFEEIFNDDDSTSNKYGIIQRLDGGGYLLTGELRFGDASGTTSTDFTDNSGTKLFVRNQRLYGGTIETSGDLGIVVEGNGTGTTNFQVGDLVGTGDGRQGLKGITISSDGDPVAWDSETDTTDVDSVELYGCVFKGMGEMKLAGSTTQEAIGCTFINCAEIQANTIEFLNNTIIAPIPLRGLELNSTSHQMKQLDFIAGADTTKPIHRCQRWNGLSYTDETVDINDAGANDVAVPTVTTYDITFSSRSVFGKLTINVGTAATGGAYAWQYFNGTAWTALSGVTDNTNGFTTSGTNDVTFTIPTNWARASHDVEVPAYFVRAICNTSPSVAASLTQGWIDEIAEHHLHIPSGTAYTVNQFNMFGFGSNGAPKWHGENSTTGTVTISASESTLVSGEFNNTGTGSSTTVNSVSDITLTGLIANTEVRVYSAGTTTEIDGVENSGTSFTFTANVAASVDIVIHHVNYEHLRIESYTIPATNTSLPIQQRFDRNYYNP